MSFDTKYNIDYKLIPLSSDIGMKRRQGTPIIVEIGVPHDTGNINSTDINNIDWAIRTLNDGWSWAHWFCDYNSITICIPCEDNPEKACHVNYGATLDNKLFGDDANDIGVGGEMCYFTDVDKTKESYKRFVWMWAYMGYKHNWMEKFGTISGRLIGHFMLQPWNRTDPIDAFNIIGVTWKQFLIDVDNEYKECVGDEKMEVEKVSYNVNVYGKSFTLDGVEKEGSFNCDFRDLFEKYLNCIVEYNKETGEITVIPK